MAILKAGPIVSEISGRVANVIFSTGLGGPYCRTGVIPMNPMTPYQTQVRAVMTSLSQAWSDTLTDAQRTAWNNFAKLHKVQNRLGDSIVLSGIAMFVRLNANIQIHSGFLVSTVLLSPPATTTVRPCNKLTDVDVNAAGQSLAFTTIPTPGAIATTYVSLAVSAIMRDGATKPQWTSIINAFTDTDHTPGPANLYEFGWPESRFGSLAVGDKITIEVLRMNSLNGFTTTPVRGVYTAT